MLDSLANRIAISIKNANPEKTNSVEVLTFALILLINGLTSFAIALFIGALTGKFLLTALAIVSFVLLRFCSGGFHFQSSVTCTWVSSALFIIIPHIPINHTWVQILTVLSLLLILVYAPARIEQHSNIPRKYYPLLKCIALVLVGMNVIIQSPILTLAFFGQAVLLIHIKRKEELT
jgi:accessory gene regulator B